jgi:hypothetical protein
MKLSTLNESKIQDMAKKAKIDISKYDPKELEMGFKAEKEEHDGGMGKDVDVLGSDTDALKVAIAHLREDPKYYTKLKKMESN